MLFRANCALCDRTRRHDDDCESIDRSDKSTYEREFQQFAHYSGSIIRCNVADKQFAHFHKQSNILIGSGRRITCTDQTRYKYFPIFGLRDEAISGENIKIARFDDSVNVV